MKRYIRAAQEKDSLVYLPDALNIFLQDVAQMVGPFGYAQIPAKVTPDQLRLLKNAKRRWERNAEYDDEISEAKAKEIGILVNRILKDETPVKSSTVINAAEASENEALEETLRNLKEDFDFIISGIEKLDRSSAEDSRMGLEIAEKFYDSMQETIAAISERF